MASGYQLIPKGEAQTSGAGPIDPESPLPVCGEESFAHVWEQGCIILAHTKE